MFLNALQLQVSSTRSVSLGCHANVPPLILLSLTTIKLCLDDPTSVITEIILKLHNCYVFCVLEFS